MKYKVSDKVKVKVTIKEPTQEITKGDICTVIDIFPNDIYQVSDEAGHHWLFVEKNA